MITYEEAYGNVDMNPAEISTSAMIRNRFGHDDSASITTSVCNELKQLYNTVVKPVEKMYSYEKYKNAHPLSASYFDSKPLILVVGPKHAGKTTFIRHVIGENYPGMEIGVEGSHNRNFTVICHDHTQNLIPGQVVITSEKYHFQDLAKFGRPFLERFNMATCTAEMVKDLWFVDTPRLDGKMSAKDKEALMWFAGKATRIVLLFDPKKLDFNSEMQTMLQQLSNYQRKFCVVLNKATGLHEMQLVKNYGTLMWNLCSIMRPTERKDEVTVYVTSFSLDQQDFNYKHRCAEMFDKDAQALLEDLRALPKEYTKHKLNTVGKRGKKVMFHAKLMCYFREKLPIMGKRGVQQQMKDNIKQHLEEAARRLNVKTSLFTYMEVNKGMLAADQLSKYKPNKRAFEKIQALIGNGIPVLLKELQGLSTDLERDNALMQIGLKKGKVKKLKAKHKSQHLKNSKKKSKRALKDLQRSRANSGDSAASKGSVFSVASIKDKISRAFSRGRRNSRQDATKFDRGSHFSPGSIVDDALSTVYNGNRSKSGRFQSQRRQYTQKRATNNNYETVRSVADDHIDLYTIVSGDDDMFSITSGNTHRNRRRRKKQSPQQDSVSYAARSQAGRERPADIMSVDLEGGGDDWAVPESIRQEAAGVFEEHQRNGRMDSTAAFRAFSRYHVQDRSMRKIWELVDFNKEGSIDYEQCAVAVFLLKQAKAQKKVPKKLPFNLIPPRHR